MKYGGLIWNLCKYDSPFGQILYTPGNDCAAFAVPGGDDFRNDATSSFTLSSFRVAFADPTGPTADISFIIIFTNITAAFAVVISAYFLSE